MLFNRPSTPQNCPFLCGYLHLSTQIAPLHGDLDPHLIHGSFGISISSAVFAELTSDCRWAYPGMPSRQNYAYPWGSGPQSSTLFLESTQAHNPNGILYQFS